MLLGYHYQNGYVCDDIEEGIAQFQACGLSKTPAVRECETYVETPLGGAVNHLKCSTFWIGELQYKVIQPISDPLGVYDNCQSNGGPLRFHHICLRVLDWQEFRRKLSVTDTPIAFENDIGPNLTKIIYVDARERFGHYLKYTWYSEAGWAENLAI